MTFSHCVIIACTAVNVAIAVRYTMLWRQYRAIRRKADAARADRAVLTARASADQGWSSAREVRDDLLRIFESGMCDDADIRLARSVCGLVVAELSLREHELLELYGDQHG